MTNQFEWSGCNRYVKSYSTNTPSTTTALSLQNTPTLLTNNSNNNKKIDRTPAVSDAINSTQSAMAAKLITTHQVD